MKSTFAILAIASVRAACECLETEENGMPPSSLFTDAGLPEDYGSYCDAWDVEDPSCQEGEANFGEDWCTEAWCYVAADNDCDPAAYDTVFFDETEYADTLKFAVSACAESSSMALYASAVMATVAVVTATL